MTYTNTKAKNNQPSVPTLLVMAGGTGGHIFPGIAVADELKQQGWNIHWLGTANKMEARIIPEHGFDISFINISGLRGKGLLSLLLMPFKVVQSVIQAKRVIKQVKPNVVLGMGGYASAPGGVAAWLSNTPLIVHEQNAAAGLSNRLLARIANKVCSAFPNAFNANVDVEVVGNPLRSSIGQKNKATTVKNDLEVTSHAEAKNKQQGQAKKVLVFGGSLGAKVLNDVMPSAFEKLSASDDSYSIWHQTGNGNQASVVSSYNEQDIAFGKVMVTEFIKDMAKAYDWADVVICRAGALTVSELAMAATPAVFIPLPHAVDDHQTKNALYLVNKEAAKLLPQGELNADNINKIIRDLFAQPETLVNMGKAALGAANPNARKSVATLCQKLANTDGARLSSSIK